MASQDTLAALREQINAVLERDGTGSVASFEPEKPSKANTAGASHDKNRPEIECTQGKGPEEAFGKVVDLLNASDKSEAMLRRRLAQLGFPEESIETAIDRAKGFGYVNDLRYGEVLLRSRISQGKGSAGIRRELAENGIDIFEIPGYPDEFDLGPDAEFSRALSLLERKPPRSKNACDSAYRKLVQRGYPSSIASSAARAWYDRSKDTLNGS